MNFIRRRYVTLSIFFVGLIAASFAINGCAKSSSAPATTFYGAGQ